MHDLNFPKGEYRAVVLLKNQNKQESGIENFNVSVAFNDKIKKLLLNSGSTISGWADGFRRFLSRKIKILEIEWKFSDAKKIVWNPNFGSIAVLNLYAKDDGDSKRKRLKI